MRTSRHILPVCIRRAQQARARRRAIPTTSVISPFDASSSGTEKTWFNATVMRFSSSNANNDNDDDGKSFHAMFQQQMMELNQERQQIFGTDDEKQMEGEKSDSVPWTSLSSEGESPSLPVDKITLEQKLEREELFQFTEAERSAWSSLAQHGTTRQSRNNLQQVEIQREEWFQRQERENEKSAALTHLSKDGTTANMVDIGSKPITARVAKAQSRVVFPAEVMAALLPLQEGRQNATDSHHVDELMGPKGPIFATAKLAGIMAAKKTSDLIPLCHPLPLSYINVEIRLVDQTAVIECECRVTHSTGVEMEALTGATVAALTIYDMVKAVSHNVRIEATQLIQKTGGKRTVG